MKIETGIKKQPIKAVIYGPEGVGKTTFANSFPDPLFLDTENGSGNIDCKRVSIRYWDDLKSALTEIRNDPALCQTIVIDTADWAELACAEYVCRRDGKKSIEDYGYGKGYKVLSEEFRSLLKYLDGIVSESDVNVVFTAHSFIRKFELPDESGSYDRYELKLTKHVAPLVKEWADLMLFANYKTKIITDESGKAKARGGQERVMYTCHHACWDAKNRAGLPEELPFKYDGIASIVPERTKPVFKAIGEKEEGTEEDGIKALNEAVERLVGKEKQQGTIPSGQPTVAEPGSQQETIIKLKSMLAKKGVDEDEVRDAVAKAGVYKRDVPIEDWDQKFVETKLLDPEKWEAFSNKFGIIEIPF